MKVRLSDALHARPANLFVRLASRATADVAIRKGDRTANGKDILGVLALGAKRGDEIDIAATGNDAARVEASLAQLVEHGFDADLVPETGSSAVEGIAVGRAVVLPRRDSAPVASTPRAKGTPEIERARLDAALLVAEAEVSWLVRVLPHIESELFTPEIEILRSLAPRLAELVDAGASAEEAIAAEAAAGGRAAAASDLVLDAGGRIAAALAGEAGDVDRLRRALAGLEGSSRDDVVLVADDLPPSVVASLPPRVVGIVAGNEGHGHASHASILARGRDLPLAFVPMHVVASVVDGEMVVVDTSGEAARVWVAPSDALMNDARARRAARTAAADVDERLSLAHLAVAVRANVGSFEERIPSAAEGVGLFRTELAFAGRSVCPGQREQRAAIAAVARRASGHPVNVRLFDAGGDKPLAWMPPPTNEPGARGMTLLFHHEGVLANQLRAIAEVRGAGADVRVLLPLVRSERDIADIRARLCGAAVLVGAMIETPEAVDAAVAIAEVADFICIGTNDLAATALGVDRVALAACPLDARLLELVARIVAAARARRRPVTVCGEIAADENAALALVGVGVDALSVGASRVARLRRRLASATREDCLEAARAISSAT